MRRMRIGLGAAALVGVIVAGLWLAWRPVAAPMAFSTRPATVAAQETLRRTARSGPAAAQPPTSTAGPAALTDCGLEGASPASAPGADADRPAPEPALDDARRDASARLLDSADPARKAAGLMLESRREQFDQARHCSDDAACAAAAGRPSPAVERLAALARESTSASAYAMALQSCGPSAPHAAASNFCASLSAERWAQLAPQSAWPWLRLAGEARGRADVSGVEYAMNQAAQVSDWRAAGAGFAAMVIDELPAELPAGPRFAMTGEAMNLEYSLFGELQELLAFCPADAEPGRRQLCRRLGERMLERTDNLLGLKIAIRLGERAGVPEARLAVFRDEAESLVKAGPMAHLLASSGPAGFGCAQVTQATVALERQARIGELAALRERLATRGSR